MRVFRMFGGFLQLDMARFRLRLRAILPAIIISFLFSLLFTAVGNPAYGQEFERPKILQKCKSCHKDYLTVFAPTKHGKIFLNNPRNELEASLCLACHGPGEAHIKDVKIKLNFVGPESAIDLNMIKSFKKHSPLTAQEKSDMCLQCHTDERRAFWGGEVHSANEVSCVDCHQYGVPIKQIKKNAKKKIQRRLHDVDIKTENCVTCHVDRRAQLHRPYHIPLKEGKMFCSLCHNPHGGIGPKLLKEASVNETCYTCHAEKRGPMLWEHAPVADNCGNCHDPHGSINPRLLKNKLPYLCQECHSAFLHSSELYDGRRINISALGADRLLGKSCLNCHSKIHGSNHPSGPRLQR